MMVHVKALEVIIDLALLLDLSDCGRRSTG
jgi:hypothetical protein